MTPYRPLPPVSHTTADLVFTWEPEPGVPLEVDERIELPQLDLESNTTGDCTQVYSTGGGRRGMWDCTS